MITKTNTPLRIGHVGVSRYGGYRRQTLKESGLFQIAALHDWNPDHLAEAAIEDGAIACQTFDDLLAVPGLDAITISSGAKYHAGQVLAALRAGFPVFVEKPLCCTAEEVREIVATQQETGLPVGLGHVDHSTNAISRTIKNLIDHGELGTIAAVEQTEAHSGGFLIQPGDWRGDANSNPGGMLFQCGVHAFHELMYHFGPISDVTSTMRYDVHGTDTADVAVCQVRFFSGLVSTLSAYHVTPYRHFLAIFGTKAALYRDDRSYFEGTMLLRQDVGRGGHEPQVIQPIEGTSDEIGNLRAFYRAVTTGRMQYPSLVDGARALAAVFAATESAKTGQRVLVEDFSAASNTTKPAFAA